MLGKLYNRQVLQPFFMQFLKQRDVLLTQWRTYFFPFWLKSSFCTLISIGSISEQISACIDTRNINIIISQLVKQLNPSLSVYDNKTARGATNFEVSPRCRYGHKGNGTSHALIGGSKKDISGRLATQINASINPISQHKIMAAPPPSFSFFFNANKI